MKTPGWKLASTGLATMTGFAAIAGANVAHADDVADPAVVAMRQAEAARAHPDGYQRPPDVVPVGDGAAPSSARPHCVS